VNVGGTGLHAYERESALDLDLNVSGSWDTTSGTNYTVAGNRAGKDFYIYICEPSSSYVPIILLSAATTYPYGYNADNSRKVGGFHCVPGNCINLPTGHPYKDFLQGDIVFNSIWDLKDRPISPPEGMVKLSLTPSDGRPALWCDIYLFTGTGTSCTSVFGATIKDTTNWMDFVDYAALQNKRLMTDAEFQKAAAGSNEETAISGASDPGTVTFPVDTAGRSMVSNYFVVGAAGILSQYLADQCYIYSSAKADWYDLPGAKGSLNKAGGTGAGGDSKLIAGGAWSQSTFCGSRCRNLTYERWQVVNSISARACSDPIPADDWS